MHLTGPCAELHSGASLSTATGVLKVGWSFVGKKAGAGGGGGGGSLTRNVKRRVSKCALKRRGGCDGGVGCGCGGGVCGGGEEGVVVFSHQAGLSSGAPLCLRS